MRGVAVGDSLCRCDEGPCDRLPAIRAGRKRRAFVDRVLLVPATRFIGSCGRVVRVACFRHVVPLVGWLFVAMFSRCRELVKGTPVTELRENNFLVVLCRMILDSLPMGIKYIIPL